jgi:hypothetical protein
VLPARSSADCIITAICCLPGPTATPCALVVASDSTRTSGGQQKLQTLG